MSVRPNPPKSSKDYSNYPLINVMFILHIWFKNNVFSLLEIPHLKYVCNFRLENIDTFHRIDFPYSNNRILTSFGREQIFSAFIHTHCTNLNKKKLKSIWQHNDFSTSNNHKNALSRKYQLPLFNQFFWLKHFDHSNMVLIYTG